MRQRSDVDEVQVVLQAPTWTRIAAQQHHKDATVPTRAFGPSSEEHFMGGGEQACSCTAAAASMRRVVHMALLRSAITSIERSPLWAPLPQGCCDHVVPPSATAHKTTKECPEPPFGYERSGRVLLAISSMAAAAPSQAGPRQPPTLRSEPTRYYSYRIL